MDDTVLPAAWIAYTAGSGLSADSVRSLAVGSTNRVWTGTQAGVDLLHTGTSGGPPIAEILHISPTLVEPGQSVSFEGMDRTPIKTAARSWLTIGART